MATTTYEQAIEQIKAQIEAKGKFSVSNVPDYVLGLASSNKGELQDLLNQFLEKKGVLSPEDQASIQAVMDKQKENRKERTKIIIRDVAVGILALGGFVGIYFMTKHKKR